MNYHLKSNNQLVVELFMTKTGDKRQDVPLSPTLPDEKICLLRARLMLEECLETIQKGLGVEVRTILGYDDGPILSDPVSLVTKKYSRDDERRDGDLCLLISEDKSADLMELADGLADCEVVNLGTASAAGIAHQPVFEEVMRNNLAKFAPGHSIDAGGKLIKPPGHKPPDIGRILLLQEMATGTAVYADEAARARRAEELI